MPEHYLRRESERVILAYRTPFVRYERETIHVRIYSEANLRP